MSYRKARECRVYSLDDTTTPCPCSKMIAYEACCAPYHFGKPPENALILMRSRYSAYALGLADYILETTHTSLFSQAHSLEENRESIKRFAASTEFAGLWIHLFEEKAKEATVVFTAHLLQSGVDVNFREKSQFLLEEGRRWLYFSGDVQSV